MALETLLVKAGITVAERITLKLWRLRKLEQALLAQLCIAHWNPATRKVKLVHARRH
jgi:hypothetical protein